MIKRIIPLAALLLLGTGCSNMSAPSSEADPYAGWGKIEPGNVVSLRIPPGCQGEPAAGSLYVTCPAAGETDPKALMVSSSDGQVVHLRRGEGKDWDQWDKVIASLRVLTPLNRTVEITIDE